MKTLPLALIEEKNKINSDSPWLLLLDLTINGTAFHLVRNNENIYFPFKDSECLFARNSIVQQLDEFYVETNEPHFESGHYHKALFIDAGTTCTFSDDYIDPQEGSFEFSVYHDPAIHTAAVGVMTALNITNAGATQWIIFRKMSLSTQYQLIFGNGTGSTTKSNIVLASGFNTIQFSWTATGTKIEVVVNGVSIYSTTSGRIPTDLSVPGYLGNSYQGTSPYLERICNVRISKTFKTKEEMIADYNLGKSFYPNTDDSVTIPMNGTLNIYRKQEYTAIAFDIDSYTQGSKGEIPSLTLSVSNVTRFLQGYIEATEGAVDSTIELSVINTKYLGDHTPELTLEFLVNQTTCNGNWVEFNLTVSNPYQKVFPKFQYVSDYCNWIENYMGAECKYSGELETCNGTLDDCRVHLNSVNFGGFPGLKNSGVRFV